MGGIDIATVGIDPSTGSFAVANNLRIASLTIAAYEYVATCVSSTLHSDSLVASYLLTLPSEIRLYKTGKRRR